MKSWGIAVVLGIMVIACEDTQPAVPLPTPPETVSLPAGAAHARYYSIAPSGKRHTFSNTDEIPIPFHSAVAVYLGQKTPMTDDGRVYVVNFLEQEGQVWEAQLMAEDQIKARSLVGLDAYEAAGSLATSATDQLEASIAVREKPKSKVRRRARSAKADGPPGIEIVSINGSARPSSKRSGKKGLAPWGWKSVTMYSTPWCGVCKHAKRWMDKNGVPYRDYNLDEDDDARQRRNDVVRRKGAKRNAVPTIVIGDEEHVMVGWSASSFTRKAAR